MHGDSLQRAMTEIQHPRSTTWGPSLSYSSVDDSGADGYSLYLDWITRVYNSNASYAVAIGNGGHGFGTTKVPETLMGYSQLAR